MERKEAIEVIKKNWPDSSFTMLREALETLIPETKESEDERIRKTLVDYFKTYKKQEECGVKTFFGIPTDNILAWLEKQGEQKTIWHNEDEEPRRGSLILLIMQSGNPIVAKVIEPNHTFNHGERWAYIDDLLENQGSPVLSNSSNIGKGEQKPDDKVEDEEYNDEDYGIDGLFHAQRILEKTLGKVDGYQTDDGILAHQCAITAVKKLYEHNPAEWSEEDEEHVNSLLKRLEGLCSNEFERTRFAINEDEDWLKSLRPQNHWKPSKAQMIALRQAISGCSYDIEPLLEIEEQLKQL